MKTYEEMAQSALARIGEYQAERKKRRKAFVRIAAPVVSCCLAAAIGIGAWQTGIFQRTPERPDDGEAGVPIPFPDGTIRREAPPEVMPEFTILRPGDEGYIAPEPTPLPDTVFPDGETVAEPPAPVGPDTQTSAGNGSAAETDSGAVTGGFIRLFWNGLVVGGPLKHAMDNDPDGVFEVLAAYHPTTGNITSFTYEGETLAQLAIDADTERILPDKMAELLKLGDELKYGTALYETGTPSGQKWDRSFYEERIAYFGEALLSRYIVDGEFLRGALEKDIAEFQETSAREKYALAYNAYLETVLPAAAERLSAQNIRCLRTAGRNDCLTLFVSAETLKTLPLETPEYWYFDLAPDGSGSVTGYASDDAGLWIVN